MRDHILQAFELVSENSDLISYVVASDIVRCDFLICIVFSKPVESLSLLLELRYLVNEEPDRCVNAVFTQIVSIAECISHYILKVYVPAIGVFLEVCDCLLKGVKLLSPEERDTDLFHFSFILWVNIEKETSFWRILLPQIAAVARNPLIIPFP